MYVPVVGAHQGSQDAQDQVEIYMYSFSLKEK